MGSDTRGVASMPNYLLLLGAGFSRNWGGWLASEAFEYLLGSPEMMMLGSETYCDVTIRAAASS